MILPRENEKDLEDVPAEVLRKMQLILVDEMDGVFEAALVPPAEERAGRPYEDPLFLPGEGPDAGAWIEGSAG